MHNRITGILLLAIVMHTSVLYAGLFAKGSVTSGYLSNTYLDASAQWDVGIHPALELEVDFAEMWAVGYNGRMEAYTRHTELFYHEHELYVLANPRFGDDDQHDLFVMAYLGTGKNTDTFESVNLLYPGLELSLGLEPNSVVYWKTSASLEYRGYYSYTANSSLDTWLQTAVTFSMPSKTSITPRVAWGYRFYPAPEALTDEPWDMQLKPGVRLAQGLGDDSGLWVDYEYLYTFNDNNMVVGQLTSAEANFAGMEFLYSGHGVSLGGKRLWGAHFEGTLEVTYQRRLYNGFILVDDTGVSTGESREDSRIIAGAGLNYERAFGSKKQNTFLLGFNYEYLRQLSNDAWYDTDSHSIQLQLALSH
ncbi:MAG: hypothetical protein JXR76_29750 [Deltaproteobacteria bacterium]|nr:hypothetical protein [Deltaproteobacteria bacterium]